MTVPGGALGGLSSRRWTSGSRGSGSSTSWTPTRWRSRSTPACTRRSTSTSCRYGWSWFPVVDEHGRFAGIARQERAQASIDGGEGWLTVALGRRGRAHRQLAGRPGPADHRAARLGVAGAARGGDGGRRRRRAARRRDGRAGAPRAAVGAFGAPDGLTGRRSAHGATLQSFILGAVPSHDVLIIGAGLAGQRAALAAAQTGATVAIISKVHPVRSHSVAAAGGINAALNPEDTLGVARVRHHQGLGLPRRPGRDRDHVPRGAGRDPLARARRRHLPPQRDRPPRHPRLRRRLGGPHLLRRRHHRPRDPARALRAADEALGTRSTATRSGSPPTCSRTRTGAASARSAATCATASWRCSTPRA